ncbi:MAG: hypothetical protein FJ382_10450 [Verrucomicrobia bacterium]|nr:hypothetical protein [Verrucomicrobiota bacterium]
MVTREAERWMRVIARTSDRVRLVGALLVPGATAWAAGGDSPSEVRLVYDFAESAHGFVSGFVDLPKNADPALYDLRSGHAPRPASLGGAPALMISGQNRSDDLFMYWSRRVTGLAPRTAYRARFVVEFASDAPSGSVGIGGSPADGVFVKVGATVAEPQRVEDRDGWWRLSLDKSNQSRSGVDLVGLGTVATPAGTSGYQRVTRSSTVDGEWVTTDEAGALWLTFGTDSGFEGLTTLYYTRLEVLLTPVEMASARLSNLSVRAGLAPGQTLIAGTTVAGGGKRFLFRAAGPALAAFGLVGVPDPSIALVPAGETQPSELNDTWEPALAAEFARLGAFGWPAGSRDAALLETVRGGITAQIVGGTAKGTVLLEAYASAGDPARPWRNLSARHRVGVGDDILIAGFVVEGSGSLRLLIRGIGPGLAGFGVAGALSDPQIAVFRGSSLLAANDNWPASLAERFTQAGAFPLAAGSRDAALEVQMEAGSSYTVHLSGVSGATGEGLIELYVLP